MSLVFHLRRAYDHGYPVGAAKKHISARGTFTVAERRDDQCRREVLTAAFTRLDGGDPVPLLREAKLLNWNGTVLSLTGVEEIPNESLGRVQRLQQTWIAEPEAYGELTRVEALFARAVLRLRQAGVAVEMLPGGGMWIEGETWPDGSPKP